MELERARLAPAAGSVAAAAAAPDRHVPAPRADAKGEPLAVRDRRLAQPVEAIAHRIAFRDQHDVDRPAGAIVDDQRAPGLIAQRACRPGSDRRKAAGAIRRPFLLCQGCEGPGCGYWTVPRIVSRYSAGVPLVLTTTCLVNGPMRAVS